MKNINPGSEFSGTPHIPCPMLDGPDPERYFITVLQTKIKQKNRNSRKQICLDFAYRTVI